MSNIKLTKDIIPGEAFHPGIILKDEIEYRKITPKELADKMHVSTLIVNNIIKGKTNITTEIAIKLEKVLDIPANIWLKLQIKFEIDTIRIRHKKEVSKSNIPNYRKEEITKSIFPTIKFA